MVKQRPQIIADAQPCHLAKKHTVRGEVLGVEEFAVEHGDRFAQCRRAGRNGVPVAELETFFGR